MRSREQGLEAPHRRIDGPARVLERTAVVAYRAASAVLARVPPSISRPIAATVAQAGYLLWPTKRRWSNANFGHVLGLPPDHPRVRRLALRAYRTYGRYVVELMRLPSGRDRVELELAGVDEVEAAWRANPGPLILSVAHIGNNEAAATVLAERGYPISVIADDTAFPELFELLRSQRRSWGVELIPWRNLREIYGVLRRGEILGVVVDWGYRADGIPCRLFDAWTTLPSGAAVLAAKTGATIIPVALRRTGSGRFRMDLDQPITVASLEPAELLRATQEIAWALERTVAPAPKQWYSFKPMWPTTAAEAVELAERAARMLGGADPPGRDEGDPVAATPGTRPVARRSEASSDTASAIDPELAPS